MYEYNILVERVVDADTIDAIVDLGYGVSINMRFRVAAELSYFDAPETWRPKSEEEREHGKAATNRAKELLEGKRFNVNSVKKGKYRYVCKITLPSGMDYGDQMIAEGYQKKDDY